MIRKYLGIALLVAGLVIAAIGIGTATIFKPSSTVVASMEDPTTPYVLIEPGVLPLVSETVTLTATASSEDLPVVIASAPASDVDAWVGDAPVTRVTGLENWSTLATEVVEGDPAAVANPGGSDLWRSEVDGTGEIVQDIVSAPHMISMLVATDGTQNAPTLTLKWTVTRGAPLFIPLLILGVLMSIAGVGVMAYQRAQRNLEDVQEASREKSARLSSANITDTSTLEAIHLAGGTLTRRQLRELERAKQAEDPRHAAGGPIPATAGAIGAGIVPGVLEAERFRALRYVDAEEAADMLAAVSGVTELDSTALDLEAEDETSLAAAFGPDADCAEEDNLPSEDGSNSDSDTEAEGDSEPAMINASHEDPDTSVEEPEVDADESQEASDDDESSDDAFDHSDESADDTTDADDENVSDEADSNTDGVDGDDDTDETDIAEREDVRKPRSWRELWKTRSKEDGR